jgi:hypothetical protein|tara:strand:- start:1771 stop:2091 length:321 start_codon:yes stop_codon:yes gene_type:complete
VIIITENEINPEFENEMTPEERLVATQNFLKLLPFILGFGWIVLIPIIYIFVAPILSDDELIKIGVTISVAIFSMIVDIVFVKIMTKNVKIMAQQLEDTSIEPFTK